MKIRYLLFALLFSFLSLVGTSCVKLQNKVIMKGEWELVYYQLDTTKANFMDLILPSYNTPPGCCKYMIDFQDNDKVMGYYYVQDTLNYSVEGTWSLDKKSTLYIALDKYVDGTFDVDRENRRNYTLTTDKNTVRLNALTVFDAPIKMEIKRRDI